MHHPEALHAKLTDYNRKLAEGQQKQQETVDSTFLELLQTLEVNKGMVAGFLFVAVGRDGCGIIVNLKKAEVSHGMTISSAACPDVARVLMTHARDAAADLEFDLREPSQVIIEGRL